jgi:hypothetical protein
MDRLTPKNNEIFIELYAGLLQSNRMFSSVHTYTFIASFVEDLTEEESEAVETAAEVLYGLIHARFILTNRGIQRMVGRWPDFFHCARRECQH